MTRITDETIERAIVRQDFFTAWQGAHAAQGAASAIGARLRAGVQEPEIPEGLRRVTFCVLTLCNGHVQVGVNYGPVTARDFDEARGRELARKAAIDQLWPLFGFALREITGPAEAVRRPPGAGG